VTAGAAPADVAVRIRPPRAAEARHPLRRKQTALETEVLSHYPSKYRRELLRRWRAKELFAGADGRLAEVDPAVRARAHQAVAAAAARDAAKKRRRRAAAATRSKNRGRR
jgi:hypothetical protein